MESAAAGTGPIGRDVEVAALRAAVTGLAEGKGGVAWIEGEPGIGKSTLIAATLGTAAAQRCRVYRAVGDEFGQRLPLRALTAALGVDAAEVVAVLDAADARDDVDASGAVPAAVERFLSVVDRLATLAPIVLAFDDLQWADEASVVAWHRLSRAVDQIPLLLLSGCRPVPVRPSVAGLRRGVVAQGALVLPLAPLPDADVAAVLGRLTGGVPGPRLRGVVAQAGGNPLYARELVDALIRERRIEVDAGTAELVGADRALAALGTAIRSRLDFLSREATGVLRIAALLGPEFSVFDLAMATGRAASALLPVLDEALAAGVLAEAGNRLEFRHGLIRECLYETTPPWARAELHRRVARALAAAGLPLDQVGGHLLAAAPQGLDGWALDWLAGNAGRLAYRAPDLAAELLDLAAGQVSDERRRADPAQVPAHDERRVPVLHGLAQALDVLNRPDEAHAAAQEALRLATGPAEAAQIAWSLAAILYVDGRYGESLPVLDEALARRGLPARWQARLRAARAKVLAATGRSDEGGAEARRAVEEGERLGDPVAIGYGLQTRYLIEAWRPGLNHVERALQVIGQEPETGGLRVNLLSNRASALEQLGQLDEAEAAIREALVLAEKVGTWRLPMVRVQLGEHLMRTGRWDDAWAELEPTAGKFGLFERLIRLGGLAFIAAHRDQRAVCANVLRQADELPPLAGYMRGNAAYVYMARAVQAEQRGGTAAALAVLADTIAIEDEADLFDRHLWLPDLTRLALAEGDTDLARSVLATADADVRAQNMPQRRAAAQRIRAMLDGDSATLLALADGYRRRPDPLFAAQSSEEAAVLLAAAGDLDGARAALIAAVMDYRDLGADWDIRRADARLRGYGLRRGPRTVQRRPRTGWAALTPTELRIAALVADGRSNPDIAAELMLSRRTVQTHVSNILTKLGHASRIEIVRAAGSSRSEARHRLD
jgi:DNA-binding CsgD family transcriptional regulator/tetratricopeptide (TPR) repeat protein